jgi:hypothetical protein
MIEAEGTHDFALLAMAVKLQRQGQMVIPMCMVERMFALAIVLSVYFLTPLVLYVRRATYRHTVR